MVGMKTPISDEDLYVQLAWVRERGFSDNAEVAFSPSTWQILGEHLWDTLRRGDASLSPLINTWGIVNRNMTGGTSQSSEVPEEIVSNLVSKQDEKDSAC